MSRLLIKSVCLSVHLTRVLCLNEALDKIYFVCFVLLLCVINDE